MNKLKIEKDSDGVKTIIKLDGRVDTNTSSEFQTAVISEMDKVNDVVIDMKNLKYISSAGLRVLLSAQKKSASKNASFKLINVGDSVMEVLDVIGFLDFLTVE